MENKDIKEFVANLPDEDKAELIGELLKGANMEAKVLVDDDNTVLIPLKRYDELLAKETLLDIMVAVKAVDKSSYMPDEIINLLVNNEQE